MLSYSLLTCSVVVFLLMNMLHYFDGKWTFFPVCHQLLVSIFIDVMVL